MSPLPLTTLEIISFSDVGGGAGAYPYPPPRPWLCVTNNPNSARWLFPDGTTVVSDDGVADDDEMITRVAVVLSRGHTQQS